MSWSSVLRSVEAEGLSKQGTLWCGEVQEYPMILPTGLDELDADAKQAKWQLEFGGVIGGLFPSGQPLIEIVGGWPGFAFYKDRAQMFHKSFPENCQSGILGIVNEE